jgi:hypothetical protein
MPDAAEIAAINATHLIETILEPADLLFVFGTREESNCVSKRPAVCGAKAFAAGSSSAAA